MNSQSYFPNYYSVEDIFVTQEKVDCKVNTKLHKMGFLDPGSEIDDLDPGKTVSLPLWYIKELKASNPYYTVSVPDIYMNVHKAVVEAESTHLELGKLHRFFYEYGRHLTPYDRSRAVGQIVYETMRQRIRHILDVSKGICEDDRPEHRLDDIEYKLYSIGVKTNSLYTNWLQMKCRNITISEMIRDYSKKRKRCSVPENEEQQNQVKRATM